MISDKKSIINLVMSEIGLDINSNFNIVDQDSGMVLKYQNKNIKYSNNNYIKINKNTEVFFNILNNLDLTTHMFSYYLEKLNMCDGIYFPIYFITRDDHGRNALVVKNNDIKITTNYYNNLILPYIDMILRIGNNTTDLSAFDT